MDDQSNPAGTILARCDVLASYSEESGCLTRRFATPALRQATDAVEAWMRATGMSVRRDNVGNLIGRYEADRPGARTLLLGSHLDTVRDAGRYDGPLGVLVALACVERLHAHDERLPFAVEVIAFTEEEGLRYNAYLGSAVAAGTFDPAWLQMTDAEGVTMAEAISAFGGDPAVLAGDARQSDELVGYCEVHIEQGPVLEARDLPVGVVTAIAGQSRIGVVFTGLAGHAGTVPMPLRRDALCAAAEFVLAAEALARDRPGLVATVGQLAVEPGASNVIPARAALTLDVRHHDDAVREEACRLLRLQATRIAQVRGVAQTWHIKQFGAVPCDASRADLLAQAIEDLGYRAERLSSGAGHDAVPLSTITPVSMLFVRCKGGISHHPNESVRKEDVAVAVEVLYRFLGLLAHSG